MVSEMLTAPVTPYGPDDERRGGLAVTRSAEQPGRLHAALAWQGRIVWDGWVDGCDDLESGAVRAIILATTPPDPYDPPAELPAWPADQWERWHAWREEHGRAVIRSVS